MPDKFIRNIFTICFFKTKQNNEKIIKQHINCAVFRFERDLLKNNVYFQFMKNNPFGGWEKLFNLKIITKCAIFFFFVFFFGNNKEIKIYFRCIDWNTHCALSNNLMVNKLLLLLHWLGIWRALKTMANVCKEVAVFFFIF